MTITVNLLAADGATSTLSLPEPTVNTGPIPLEGVLIQSGSLVFDGSGSALALAAPNGSANQLWSLVTGSSGAIFLVPSGNTSVAVDWTTLALGTIWDSTSSNQSTWYVPGPPLEFLSGMTGTTLALQVSNGALVMGPQGTPGAFTLETPPAPPPPVQGASYAPSNYVKVWEDTFTGTSLDITKWWTRYGTLNTQQYIPSNNEQEIFEEGQDGEPNHVMTGSSVKLTAYGPRASDGRYPSGMLRCKQTFNFGSLTTGFYIEIVCKIPNAQGAWPALWMGPEPKSATVPPPWPPEMDFAEWMINSANGDTSSMVGVNVQLNGANPPNVWNSDNWSYGSPVPAGWVWNSVGRTKWETTEDFSQAFHTFALQCVPGVAGQQTVNPITGQPTHMLYYFCDGYNTFNSQYDSNIGADGSTGWNSELLIDLAVGGTGGGTPNNADFPCALEIQRVSIFLSQEDSAALVPSVVGTDYLPASGG